MLKINIAFMVGLVVFLGCVDDSMQAFWGTKMPKDIQEVKNAFQYNNDILNKIQTAEQNTQTKEEHLQPLNNKIAHNPWYNPAPAKPVVAKVQAPAPAPVPARAPAPVQVKEQPAKHQILAHVPVNSPFAIQQPVLSYTGEIIIENTVGGIAFDCRTYPTGHWRDPQFCDVFHACVHGYHRKTYACPVVGHRTYFDEVTQRCEFVHNNLNGCASKKFKF